MWSDSTFLDLIGVLVTILLSVVGTAAWYLHQQHIKYDHLPGPPRDSFWSGHLPSIQKVVSKGGIFDDYILKLAKTHGKLFRICMWNQTFLIISDHELVKEVLVTGNYPKSKSIYTRLTHVFGARYIGNGLETELDQKVWIVQRMHFNHWFKPHYLRQFTPVLNEYADSLVHQLEKYADGKTHTPMEDLFHKVTLHLLSKVAFNFDLGKLDGTPHPFEHYLTFALAAFSKQLVNPFFSMNPFHWKYCLQVRGAVAKLRLYAKEQITGRRNAKRRGDYVPDDLLQSILESKDRNPQITEETLLDNFITFLIAGQETTANTLGFMISLLARNPQCYKRLQKEIDTNVAAASVLTPAELEDLPYLDMVMKETLRLFPVAKTTFRETVRTSQLGGYSIPAGTDMVVSFYVNGRSTETLTNPLQFIPERFDPKASEKIGTYVSTPFSVGPHSCIGKKLAEVETKIIMAKIVQNFDFDLVPGQPLGAIDSGTLRIAGGAKCFLRPRTES